MHLVNDFCIWPLNIMLFAIVTMALKLALAEEEKTGEKFAPSYAKWPLFAISFGIFLGVFMPMVFKVIIVSTWTTAFAGLFSDIPVQANTVETPQKIALENMKRWGNDRFVKLLERYRNLRTQQVEEKYVFGESREDVGVSSSGST